LDKTQGHPGPGTNPYMRRIAVSDDSSMKGDDEGGPITEYPGWLRTPIARVKEVIPRTEIPDEKGAA
jgi:hypothetical protein